MYDFLKNVTLFGDLGDEDMRRICSRTQEIRLESGQCLFNEGDTGDRAYVIREGEVEVLKISGGRDVLLAVRRAGDVIGEMSLLEEAPRMASARARGPVTLVTIERKAFEELLETSTTATRALLQTVIERLRGTEARLRQGERMAQIGQMTAGLAHELNNPAAAAARAAERLREAESNLLLAARRFERAGPASAEKDALDALLDEVSKRARGPGDLDPLTRSDREADLEAVLEELGHPSPWDAAPALVAAGFDPTSIREISRAFDASRLPDALELVARAHASAVLLGEIHESTRRIAGLVNALKRHVQLDQAPVQLVDVAEGLDDTLVILRSKLTNVRVLREYAKDLPRIQGLGSELNQVWTNLVDNAIHAMDRKGTLRLRTFFDDESVGVEVEDDGPGIPEEIRERIFEPFFTTKGPGGGMGLGLDMCWNIVVNRHGGSVGVESRPGRTVFRVTLPRDAKIPSRGPPSAGSVSP
jgi:signal transduction histidine kinase